MSLMLSLVTQLYIQQIVQAAEELNALQYWPFVRGIDLSLVHLAQSANSTEGMSNTMS